MGPLSPGDRAGTSEEQTTAQEAEERQQMTSEVSESSFALGTYVNNTVAARER